MARKSNRSPEKDDAFCERIAAGDTILDACKAVGYGFRQIFQYRHDDPQFAQKWEDADEMAIQRMEREADRRAIEGVNEPVFHKGEMVGTIKKFSDTLLIFRLKAKRPEVYRERADVSGNLDITINLAQRVKAARDREK